MSDAAYTNFLQFRDESEDLGLRGCNLEAIMNEVRRVLYPYVLLLVSSTNCCYNYNYNIENTAATLAYLH